MTWAYLSLIYFNVFHFMSPNVFIFTQLRGSVPKCTCCNHSSPHLYQNEQSYFIPYSPKWATSARLGFVLFACQTPANVLCFKHDGPVSVWIQMVLQIFLKGFLLFICFGLYFCFGLFFKLLVADYFFFCL